jgi:hypothetical protein
LFRIAEPWFRRARNFFSVSFCNRATFRRLSNVSTGTLDLHMHQAIETASRRSMTRECLVNSAVATGVLGAAALLVLASHSLLLWFFAKYLWMW